jgi:hypothetical protein
MSQRLSAKEWVKQEEARRRGILPSSESSRQMPPRVQMASMEPTEQELRVGQQMVRNMDEQYGKRIAQLRRMEESKARQMDRDLLEIEGERIRAERRRYEVQQAEEAQGREMEDWRDQVDHARARERARQASQPKQSRPSDVFLGNFTSGDKEYSQFAVQQPDGKTRVALAVKAKEPFQLY